MAQFIIAGQTYNSGKMDAFTQFHVARRLASVLSALKEAHSLGKSSNMDALEAAAMALSGMSDADSEYVLKACLDVTKRQQGAAWASLRVNGRMMFDDIDLPAMMQIAWEVLQENFLPFFSGLLGPNSQGGETAA